MTPRRTARTGKTVRRMMIRDIRITPRKPIPRRCGPLGLLSLAVLALADPVAAQTVVGPTTLTIEDALAAHGDWVVIPGQGTVWFPRVGAGWAPQRDGQWQWREPGGWAWMEAAPWGAYVPPNGRWMEINRRWAWVPQAPPRSMVVPVPVPGMGGPPMGVPPNLAAPAPIPVPLPGVIRPEAPVQHRPAPLVAGAPRITRSPEQPSAAPPVIGAPNPYPGQYPSGHPSGYPSGYPGQYPGYYPGPMIQRPDAVVPPARVVNPPPGAAPVPTRPATPYPPGPAYGTVPVYPTPMPYGGGTVVTPVQPSQPQPYRSVPGR